MAFGLYLRKHRVSFCVFFLSRLWFFAASLGFFVFCCVVVLGESTSSSSPSSDSRNNNINNDNNLETQYLGANFGQDEVRPWAWRAAGDKKTRVAIVGAGVCGGATAHHVRRLLQDDADVQVYDARLIGGRVQHVAVRTTSGAEINAELGRSGYTAASSELRALAKVVGLDEVPEPAQRVSVGVHTATAPGLAALGRGGLVRRYGMMDVLAVQRAVRRAEAAMASVRAAVADDTQAPAFDPWDLLALGGGDAAVLANATVLDVLCDAFAPGGGGSKACGGAQDAANRPVVRDLVAAVARAAGVLGINGTLDGASALPVLLSLAPLLGAGDTFTASHGGMRPASGVSELPRSLLKNARAEVHIDSPVRAVVRSSDGGLALKVQRNELPKDADPKTHEGVLATRLEGPFDAVVLCMPLEGSGIRFEGMPASQSESPLAGNRVRRAFLSRTTTIVRGKPSTMLAKELDLRPAAAGAVHRLYAKEGKWRMAELLDGGSTDALMRISSDAELESDDLVPSLFANVTGRGSQTWNLDTCRAQEDYARFELAPRLIWAVSGECATSTLEMAAIAARNAAKMVQIAAHKRAEKRRRNSEENASNNDTSAHDGSEL